MKNQGIITKIDETSFTWAEIGAFLAINSIKELQYYLIEGESYWAKPSVTGIYTAKNQKKYDLVSIGEVGVQTYNAMDGVLVTANTLGVTAQKTNGIWTLTLPSNSPNVKLVGVSINVKPSDIQTTPNANGSVNWVSVIFNGNLGGVVDNYKFPIFTSVILPDTGISAQNPAICDNSRDQFFTSVGSGSITTLKINMSSANAYVLNFSNF